MLTLALGTAEKRSHGYVYVWEELNVKSIKTGKAADPQLPLGSGLTARLCLYRLIVSHSHSWPPLCGPPAAMVCPMPPEVPECIMPAPCITVDIGVGPAVRDMVAALARVTGACLLPLALSSILRLSASADGS
jgi:hypothetical protein